MPDDVFLGEIRMFGGDFPPDGFFLCNGQLLSINQYTALYSLIGTTYGGDGTNTFMLPDLRGRVPIHMDGTFTLGLAGGAETVVLLPNNLPAHSHSVAASDTGGSDTPKGNAWGATTSANIYAAADNFPIQMSTLGISTEGKSKPHENMSPYLCVSFIIAWSGIFPSRPSEGEQP
jgi:microcystin-dependent protein